jgi:hypothetical protein
MTKVAHLRVIDANGEVVEHEDTEQENRALRAALTRAENVIKGLRSSSRRNARRRDAATRSTRRSTTTSPSSSPPV